MAVVANDINVFDLPHNHMKRLVGEIEQQVISTNYGDEESYQHLLDLLNNGFNKLLSHEAIEDHYIIHPLLPRLPSTVKVTLQNDVHSDNRLARLHSKVKTQLGMTIVSHNERLHFGKHLQKELFDLKLISHMNEEEEVFQPLLLEYFTQQELRVIKKTVLQLHDLPSEESVAEVVTSPSILHVPPEVLLQIFKYLSPQDLCRCAQVNSVFSKSAFDGSLWYHLHPVKWFSGNWKFLPPRRLNLQQLEDDCDEEDESTNSDNVSFTVRLCDFVRHLLPKVGEHVKTLDLTRAGRMDIKYLYQALTLCPNLTYLDLSYTSTSDFAFTGMIRNHSASKLEYLNLSGCMWITDLTLERLAKAFKRQQARQYPRTCSKPICKDSSYEKPKLCSFKLSGCHLITDKGLRMLGSVGEFPCLKLLDFSGLHKITAAGLDAFLHMCPKIRPDMLSYCDDIMDGPFSNVANGCQNVDSSKICCRNL